MNETQYDLIIVGCGPAGVSAALYAGRANLKTLVLGGADSALQKAEKIENYYGLSTSLTGAALFEEGLRQIERLGVPLQMEEVTNLDYMEDYLVETEVGNAYHARAVLLCTGAKRLKPQIRELDRFEGRGVSYCAVCDAFFYRGKKVGVLGSGPYALHEVSALLPVAGEVLLFTNGIGRTAEFPQAVRVIDTPIKELRGEGKLAEVLLDNGETLALDGLFIALGTAGASDLARKLGAEVNGTRIVTDENMATMLPGLYAAGDCTGGLMQVATAVSEGAKAAMSAIAYLRNA